MHDHTIQWLRCVLGNSCKLQSFAVGPPTVSIECGQINGPIRNDFVKQFLVWEGSRYEKRIEPASSQEPRAVEMHIGELIFQFLYISHSLGIIEVDADYPVRPFDDVNV